MKYENTFASLGLVPGLACLDIRSEFGFMSSDFLKFYLIVLGLGGCKIFQILYRG